MNAGSSTENSVYSWPNLFIAELFVFVFTLAVILILAMFFDAPLEEPVNMTHPPNPAKAPWYFLGLQELVSYSAFWAGVGIPGLMVVGLLIAPYIDRGRKGVEVVRQGAAVGQYLVRELRDPQRDFGDYRHLLPRAELGVRFPLVNGTLLCD